MFATLSTGTLLSVASSTSTGSSADARRSLFGLTFGDLVLPLLFVVLIVATYLQPSLGGDAGNPDLVAIDPLWLILGLTGAGALALRRRYPLGSAIVVMSLVTVVAVIPYDLDPIAWMVYVSAFALGRHASTRHAVVGLGLFTVTIVLTYLSPQNMPVSGLAFAFAFFLIAWLVGKELSRWRERVDMQRLEADRRVEIERKTAELALAEERLQLAQELHDVVAHSMSVIAVQAGMAEAAFDRRPDDAKRAVSNILATSKGSLAEIRRLLGVLRDDPPKGPASYSPAPTLKDLPELIASVEMNGVEVELRSSASTEAPAGIQLSAYRIVQEALTNVLEHSGATKATVAIDSSADGLEIEVVDNGNGPSTDPGSSGGGFGLVGMGERVSTYGGRLDTGPGPGGGFRVRATIPYPETYQ